jgi:hypothetical protein
MIYETGHVLRHEAGGVTHFSRFFAFMAMKAARHKTGINTDRRIMVNPYGF